MAKTIDSPLARELSRQRLRRDWLAAKLGVGPWTFSRIEAGVISPPADWYTRAAAELGVDVSVILPDNDPVAA